MIRVIESREMIFNVLGHFSSVSLSDALIVITMTLIAGWALRSILEGPKSRRTQILNLARELPGPSAWPFVGNALSLACKSEELLDRIKDIVTPYPDATPMRFWMGSTLFVVVTAPRDIETVMNSRQATSKGMVYKFLHPFLGDGLISGSGTTWKLHRKLTAPMLNQRRILEIYFSIVEKHCQTLLRKLRPLSDGSEFNILRPFENCTADMMCEAVMGCTSINAQENPGHEFTRSASKFYEVFHARVMQVWLHYDWLYRLTFYYKEQRELQRIIRKFSEMCIEERMKKFFETTTSDFDDDRISILDRLIDAVVPTHLMTRDELRDEIFTIYIAAQDTVALVSSFAALMLGMHSEVQDKTREEINKVLEDGEITVKSLSKLKYLEMVIKETMRLFPIAPMTLRSLDDKLHLENCTLPKGCQVVVASYVTQRSPKYWNDAEKFIPERFSSDEIKRRHPCAYIPFSVGPMGCIGQKFAMMCLKMVIANVLRNYKINAITRLDDVKLKPDISTRSVHGYSVSLQSLQALS